MRAANRISSHQSIPLFLDSSIPYGLWSLIRTLMDGQNVKSGKETALLHAKERSPHDAQQDVSLSPIDLYHVHYIR